MFFQHDWLFVEVEYFVVHVFFYLFLNGVVLYSVTLLLLTHFHRGMTQSQEPLWERPALVLQLQLELNTHIVI